VAEIEANTPDMKREFLSKAKVGIESEFREITRLKGKEVLSKWRQMAVPQVCPARMCDFYGPCLYYRARREAAKAGVVVTNHSVVLMDALQGDENTSPILGDYDFLIVDEAHDLPQAALSAFEFTLDERALSQVASIASGLERVLRPRAVSKKMEREFTDSFGAFRKIVESVKFDLSSLATFAPRSGILAAAPSDVAAFPSVAAKMSEPMQERVFPLAASILSACKEVDAMARRVLKKEGDEVTTELGESALQYRQFLAEFALNCKSLANPEDGSVSYIESGYSGVVVKKAAVDAAPKLTESLWSKAPSVCLSATLAIDSDFEFFTRLTGVTPRFSEILPSPFEFENQAAVYLPKEDSVPDPVAVRREGAEDLYYAALAKELQTIIRALGGRTLALFHSRAEMQGVLEKVDLPDDLPVYVQRKSGAGTVGESFRNNVSASLFALRSFWTGFDAPGETLSCVALTRIPFDVPVDPPSLARQASMTLAGRDPFREYSLAMAKMLMRQGAGRLIRNSEDKGIIAILDPRVRTKYYGEAILQNLPPSMRTFNDIYDAMAAVGIEG
jgi:ATP-dependent DNA helicase DinG